MADMREVVSLTYDHIPAFLGCSYCENPRGRQLSKNGYGSKNPSSVVPKFTLN